MVVLRMTGVECRGTWVKGIPVYVTADNVCKVLHHTAHIITTISNVCVFWTCTQASTNFMFCKMAKIISLVKIILVDLKMFL